MQKDINLMQDKIIPMQKGMVQRLLEPDHIQKDLLLVQIVITHMHKDYIQLLMEIINS